MVPPISQAHQHYSSTALLESRPFPLHRLFLQRGLLPHFPCSASPSVSASPALPRLSHQSHPPQYSASRPDQANPLSPPPPPHSSSLTPRSPCLDCRSLVLVASRARISQRFSSLPPR